MIKEVLKYSFSDFIRMGYAFVLTKIFYPGALLVRRPISIRQKKGFHYGKRLTTGKNCRIEIFAEGVIEMGSGCQIGDNTHLVASKSVRIGNDCLFASKIFVSDTSHGSYGADPSSPLEFPNSRPLVSNPVVIGDRVWLGENVVVLGGVTIGEGSIVGAGSVVTKSIPANCIAVGSPARAIKKYNFDNQIWETINY